MKDKIPAAKLRPDGKYKYLGGVNGRWQKKCEIYVKEKQERERCFCVFVLLCRWNPDCHPPIFGLFYLAQPLYRDGNIYFIPADADYVTKLNPHTGVATQIGATLEHEGVNHTKWQNGYMAPDGCIYSIPHGGRTVCKINLETQEVCTLKLPEPRVQLSKWEGGVVVEDGTLYCMPMCSKHVLKVSPHVKKEKGAAPKGWGDGKAHD
jgi:hypothetical protein